VKTTIVLTLIPYTGTMSTFCY